MPELDGKHVVFGEVLKGFATVDKMEKVGTENSQPKKTVTIVRSGELAGNE